MRHVFINNTCKNCGLKRTKVDRSTTEYGSRTRYEWGYFMLPDTEIIKTPGHCKKEQPTQ